MTQLLRTFLTFSESSRCLWSWSSRCECGGYLEKICTFESLCWTIFFFLSFFLFPINYLLLDFHVRLLTRKRVSFNHETIEIYRKQLKYLRRWAVSARRPYETIRVRIFWKHARSRRIFGLDSLVEITSLGRVPSIGSEVCRVYLQASLFLSAFSPSLAETGCRFHEILPVMSAASITRHYPSISRFQIRKTDGSKKDA